MGSKLRDRTTGETVWVDFGSIPKNILHWQGWLDHLLDTMAYPNDNLEPSGIMDEVVIVPPWAKQEHYGRLFQALERMGYRADSARHAENELDVYAFAYDWRQDNRISARQLGEAIERWRAHHPGAQAWIIAHSNGGLVSRWYIEREGGKDRVGRLFLMGSPWDGSPKSMRILFGGLDMLFRRRFNLFDLPQRSRDLLRTFPSAYQLIPYHNPFLRNKDNEPIDPFTGTGWIDNDEQHQLLLQGRRFNEDLETAPSVETLCFFGRKKPTVTHGIVDVEAQGRWKDIAWAATEAGDGTVTEHSAVHPHAHRELPFAVGHGDIYVNPAVLEFLEWELIDKYRRGDRALVTTARLSVLFEPDRDVYAPGDSIVLSAQVLGAADEDGKRPHIEDAAIQVVLEWQRPLPGDEPSRAPERSIRASLAQTREPGRYAAELRAPEQEGYYRLTGMVDVLGEPSTNLSELVVVEETE
jgi:pimeloyl-ACP methyl ester carboxylesterase